jgi:heptose I phosphotransferase
VISLQPQFAASLPDVEDPFEFIMGLDGELYREMNGRRTLRFQLAGRSYFLKAHAGVGWKGIFEDLAELKRPVIGAGNEWRGIHRLEGLGVATTPLVGYGQRGMNPARLRSFVVTEELTHTQSLEDVCLGWDQRPRRPGHEVRFKRALIQEVARIARTLHENGLNHRDFYLCHFLLDCRRGQGETPRGALRLFLIDLHRMEIRNDTPLRWVVKDIGGLYFSGMDIGLTRRDLYRFMACYRGKPLREALAAHGFWEAVRRRAHRLYRSERGRDPVHAV